MKANYRQMPDLLKNRMSFRGNSVTAIRDNGTYKVYSYDTLIYSSNAGYFNNKYFSVTTSKIQNMLIDVFNLNNGEKKRC